MKETQNSYRYYVEFTAESVEDVWIYMCVATYTRYIYIYIYLYVHILHIFIALTTCSIITVYLYSSILSIHT